MRYITRGLVEVLLDLSRAADPSPVTASLAVSRASDLLTATEADAGGAGPAGRPGEGSSRPDGAAGAGPTATANSGVGGVDGRTRGSVDGGEAAADGGADAGRPGSTAGLADLDPETPVFTDFYLPDTAKSVRAVFGVDLSTPPGQTQGRFVSHPTGELEVTKEDDLHETVFVAAPPWSPERVGAFDRSGRRHELTVLDAYPREESYVEP